MLFFVFILVVVFCIASVFYKEGHSAGVSGSCNMVEYISKKYEIATSAIKEIKDEIEQNYTKNAPVLDLLLGIIEQTEKELNK